MSEKRFNTRIVNKHDTEVNWSKSSLIPLQGEVIIFDVDENYSYERIKIGDGVQNVNDLPFVGGSRKNVFYATMAKSSSTAYNIVATVDDDSFTYEAGNIVVLVCTKSLNKGSSRTININKLGTINLYTESTDSTFTSLYGYDYAIDAYEVLLLFYDNYNHFVVINNRQEILESQLSVALQGRIEQISTNEANIESLSTLIGDTSVSKQIEEITYTQAQVDAFIAAVKEFCLPKIRTITLTENNWVFSANYYYQDVPVGVCTPTSKVDLQPTYSQLALWQDDGLAFTTQSRDGIVRVWAIPEAPREDVTVQISIQEVLGV